MSRRTWRKDDAMRLVPRTLEALVDRIRGEEPERGDVPGWVMVTVMTAALVLAILGVFQDAIVEAVQNALNSVTTGG